MVTINPNHVDLDLHHPIGWFNTKTHILHIKLHQPTVQLFEFLSELSKQMYLNMIMIIIYVMYNLVHSYQYSSKNKNLNPKVFPK